MIEGGNGFLGIQGAWPVQIANQLFFLVSMLTTGWPHAV
jgi:hypothetical protein